MKHHRKYGSSGSVLVEFSLVVPLLTLLFLGTFQYGYAFFLYSELEKSVRAGARYASMRRYAPSTVAAGSDPESDLDYVSAVRDTVMYGDIRARDMTVVPNLEAGHVVVTMPEYAAQPIRVRVCINDYSVGFFWPVQMNNKPCVEFPYVGHFEPKSL